MKSTWITTKEAAALLGKDHSTIRRWVAGGRKLKAVRVGKINLVSRRSVEREIERRNGTVEQGEGN